MLRPTLHQRSDAAEEDVPELAPVFVVVVEEEGHLRVGKDVSDAAELHCSRSLGFLVDDGVDGVAVKGVADGHDVGSAVGIGGGETGDAGFGDEAADFGGEGQRDLVAG